MLRCAPAPGELGEHRVHARSWKPRDRWVMCPLRAMARGTPRCNVGAWLAPATHWRHAGARLPCLRAGPASPLCAAAGEEAGRPAAAGAGAAAPLDPGKCRPSSLGARHIACWILVFTQAMPHGSSHPGPQRPPALAAMQAAAASLAASQTASAGREQQRRHAAAELTSVEGLLPMWACSNRAIHCVLICCIRFP